PVDPATQSTTVPQSQSGRVVLRLPHPRSCNAQHHLGRALMRKRVADRLGDFLRILPVVALDACIVVASYAAALALRFDGDVPSESIRFFLIAAPFIAASYLVGNVLFRIYRTSW